MRVGRTLGDYGRSVSGPTYCSRCYTYSLREEWDYQDVGTAGSAEQCPCCGEWRNPDGIYTAPYAFTAHSSGPFEDESMRVFAARTHRRVTPYGVDVPASILHLAAAKRLDPAELHQRVQLGIARYEAGVAHDAERFRWRRRWWRLRNAPSDVLWQVRLQRLRRRKQTTLYVSGCDERAEALLNLLAGSGYHLHRECRFSGYHRFGAEVDACDALLFIGEEAHASAHRALMSLYIAAGHTIALGAHDRPLADRPRKRPIFVLELWEQAPNRYGSFMEAHPEIVLLDLGASQAVAQITQALPASGL